MMATGEADKQTNVSKTKLCKPVRAARFAATSCGVCALCSGCAVTRLRLACMEAVYRRSCFSASHVSLVILSLPLTSKQAAHNIHLACFRDDFKLPQTAALHPSNPSRAFLALHPFKWLLCC